jgi:hypothetical protein
LPTSSRSTPSLGGRFNDAEARLFQVNPEHSGYGAIKVLLGIVTDVQSGRRRVHARGELRGRQA